MNDYREIRIDINPCTEDGTDVMAWLLAEVGFESFVPDANGLTAYIRKEDYDAARVNDALAQYPFAAALEISSKVIEGQDWNSEWEKNYFQPIVVGDRCVIHSSFHKDVPHATYDIVIDPKMAFGTGHHATTSQVIEALLGMNLEGKTVTDMGTGTGILAILAAMLGAKHITAIEIDSFAYANAVENAQLNNVSERITMINGDADSLENCPVCDVFVANINRNVITSDMAKYVGNLKAGATVVFSGFYVEDIPVVKTAGEPYGLKMTGYTEMNNWACVKMVFESQKQKD